MILYRIKVTTLYQIKNGLPLTNFTPITYTQLSHHAFSHTHTTPTSHMCGLVPLLREQITGEALLPFLVPGELEVDDGPALVAGYPDSADVGEFCESVWETLEVVPSDVEDGEGGEGRDV